MGETVMPAGAVHPLAAEVFGYGRAEIVAGADLRPGARWGGRHSDAAGKPAPAGFCRSFHANTLPRNQTVRIFWSGG